MLVRALSMRMAGPYQLQAAIAAVHSEAPTPAETDWPQIAALYDELVRAFPSPVVELNRAVAVSLADGPAEGLELVDRIEGLDDYHLLHSTRGNLLGRLGREDEARAAYARALELASNDVERAVPGRACQRVCNGTESELLSLLTTTACVLQHRWHRAPTSPASAWSTGPQRDGRGDARGRPRQRLPRARRTVLFRRHDVLGNVEPDRRGGDRRAGRGEVHGHPLSRSISPRVGRALVHHRTRCQPGSPSKTPVLPRAVATARRIVRKTGRGLQCPRHAAVVQWIERRLLSARHRFDSRRGASLHHGS